MSLDSPLAEHARRAASRFEALRDQLVAAFETLEREAPADLFAGEPGRFALTPWTRAEGGGGVMGMLRGRLFEKCGLHLSKVEGAFGDEMAAAMPHIGADRRFVATGVSLIAHMRSPRIPAVHFNARYIATTRGWFGGGADLTPLLAQQRRDDAPDALAFHSLLRAACERHHPAWYERFKAECDRYFFLPHRDEARGIGGVFFDRHDSGDFERDLAFATGIGEAVLAVWPAIVRRRMAEPWTSDEREEQLIRRGRYVEFNLLYDRGTLFGLKTGGNIESILSSMPPVVKWP